MPPNTWFKVSSDDSYIRSVSFVSETYLNTNFVSFFTSELPLEIVIIPYACWVVNFVNLLLILEEQEIATIWGIDYDNAVVSSLKAPEANKNILPDIISNSSSNIP